MDIIIFIIVVCLIVAASIETKLDNWKFDEKKDEDIETEKERQK